MNDLRKIWNSIRFAMQGIGHAYNADRSFRLEINWGIPAYAILGYSLSPLQAWEIIVLALSYLLILILELLNTSIEHMLERLHPEQHELIGKSKDIAAAAVLLGFIFAIVVVASLVWQRCGPLLLLIGYPLV